MPHIPHALRNDLLSRLARDRYNALAVLRADTGGGDRCPVRMLGRPGLALRGPEGARQFYDEDLMQRKGAIPLPLRLLLFGPGAIHGLDGEAHRRRKQLFLDIVTPDAVERLAAAVGMGLDIAAQGWAQADDVTLFDELVEVYGTAVIRWAGIEADDAQCRRISHELALIVDGFGIGGTGYPRAMLARLRAQAWAMGVVREARAGRRSPTAGTALRLVAASRLPDLVAATELLNILRPTVAVAYFGAPAAVQLHTHDEWRDLIAQGSVVHRRAFQLEIRRWYPFAPALAARTRQPVDGLPTGSFVILDILGTDRDPGAWEEPEKFLPERFLEREPGPFDFVPQGGGDPATGHRCPGEPIAQALLEQTIEYLAGLRYSVADGSEEVSINRIPALPPNRVELRHVEAPVRAHH